jgi:hypothetical protein
MIIRHPANMWAVLTWAKCIFIDNPMEKYSDAVISFVGFSDGHSEGSLPFWSKNLWQLMSSYKVLGEVTKIG